MRNSWMIACLIVAAIWAAGFWLLGGGWTAGRMKRPNVGALIYSDNNLPAYLRNMKTVSLDDETTREMHRESLRGLGLGQAKISRVMEALEKRLSLSRALAEKHPPDMMRAMSESERSEINGKAKKIYDDFFAFCEKELGTVYPAFFNRLNKQYQKELARRGFNASLKRSPANRTEIHRLVMSEMTLTDAQRSEISKAGQKYRAAVEEMQADDGGVNDRYLSEARSAERSRLLRKLEDELAAKYKAVMGKDYGYYKRRTDEETRWLDEMNRHILEAQEKGKKKA